MNIREGKEIEKNYYSLGMLIRMGCLHAGINQDDFAREVGVSVTTLSKWETDASRPTARNLRKLEAIFNMTL
ncbi:MAG: helix-turn-helix transcriptional regulator, partial [Acidaminococcaceae bacterium]|nr:helix-turn-helix transcriptional regulator [Acidaminococcaceae bacterium]